MHTGYQLCCFSMHLLAQLLPPAEPPTPPPPSPLPTGWWYKPDFIINDLNVQSAIGYPAHDEVVPLSAGTYAVRGYAYCGECLLAVAQASFPCHPSSPVVKVCRPQYCCCCSRSCAEECCLSRLSLATCPSTGAGNKIIRCEVSLDDGKSWRLAEVTHRTPPNEYGKHWAWVWWSIDVPIGETAASCFLPDVQREGKKSGLALVLSAACAI